jgi:hypothetical protein
MTMPETRDARATWLQARFAPTSFDAAARTVEVVWSTGAGVRRRDWEGEYVEELDMSPAAVDLTRLAAGAPVLNSHDAWDLESVLGVVERAWIEGGEGRAVLRFSEREEVAPILGDIRDGILRNISVGYDVTRWEETKGPDGKRIKRAVRWQPAEISLVPIPADASAQVRAAETPSGDGSLPNNPSAAHAAEENPMPNPGTPAQDTAPLPDENTIRTAERAAERARLAELRSVGRVAARSLLSPERVAELEDAAVQAGIDARAFQAQLFEEAARASETVTAPTPRPIDMRGTSADDPNAIREALSDAIAVRYQPAHKPGNDHYRKYAGWRISDMARALLEARGERNLPRNPVMFAERAFHTTSDFPLLLSASANKMLLAAYGLATPTYRKIGARKVFNDFKPHRFLRAGDFPNLTAVAENGEIQVGTIGESQELVTLATFGRRVRVTRQVLINDDLSAFGDFAGMIGRRVVDFENRTFYAVVNTASGAGPTLVTGNAAVFATAAGRANRAASGGAIDVTSIGAGRAAIMKQTSVDGLQVGILPSMLLCGPDYLTVAQQLTSSIQPQQAGNVNPFAGMLEPVGEASIPGNRWYLFADPEAAPVYIYGYLDGADGPQVTSGPVQGVDGFEVQVIHDFAAGAVDWRGGWFNPGA